MPQFRHILFPVDFSDRCNLFGPLVSAVAKRFRANVTLMHVVQLTPGWYGGVDMGYPVIPDHQEGWRIAQTQLDNFCREFQSYYDQTPGIVLEDGDAATLITEYSGKHSVDLIMMPTHGCGRFRRFLLGSVTAKVLQDAQCAVWTAAHNEDPEFAHHLECRNVCCAIDLHRDSIPLLRSAAELAEQFGASVQLVHAVTGADSDDETSSGTEFRRFLFQTARDRISGLQAEAGTKMTVCLHAGHVSKVVHAAALQHNADLVMIGRGKIHSTLGRLRTHAYAIINNSPCSVLSI